MQGQKDALNETELSWGDSGGASNVWVENPNGCGQDLAHKRHLQARFPPPASGVGVLQRVEWGTHVIADHVMNGWVFLYERETN